MILDELINNINKLEKNTTGEVKDLLKEIVEEIKKAKEEMNPMNKLLEFGEKIAPYVIIGIVILIAIWFVSIYLMRPVMMQAASHIPQNISVGV